MLGSTGNTEYYSLVSKERDMERQKFFGFVRISPNRSDYFL